MVSGRGSNMLEIIKAVKDKRIENSKVVLVLSDNRDAQALEIAQRHGIKNLSIPAKNFKTKLEGEPERKFIEEVKKARPDLIVLAGFMRVIKPGFINSFPDKIINIHPSLLPKYPGLNTHKKAMEAMDIFTGCTVHYVDEVVDGGKRIMQARVPILQTDNEGSLAHRVLEKEHIILPKVINMIAAGQISYNNLPDEPLQY